MKNICVQSTSCRPRLRLNGLNSHTPVPDFIWDSSRVALAQSDEQIRSGNQGVTPFSVRNDLAQEGLVLHNAVLLDFLLDNREEIPVCWGGKTVWFPETVFLLQQGGGCNYYNAETLAASARVETYYMICGIKLDPERGWVEVSRCTQASFGENDYVAVYRP